MPPIETAAGGPDGRFVVPAVKFQLTGPRSRATLGRHEAEGREMRAGAMAQRGTAGPRGRAVSSQATSGATIVADASGAVIAWNATAEELFGWSASELIGRRLPIVPRDLWPDFGPLLETTARDLPSPSQQAALSAVGSARMEAVGRLAGAVAHDFNNILSAIAGYASLLAGELPSDDPKQRDVAEIRKATERATRLTRQLLAFGRREAQETRHLDLNDVLADVLPMLRQLIGEHIEVITNATLGLPAVLADPSQLEQVLVNLVLNARDAMPDGGRLIVSTSAVVLDDAFLSAHPGSKRGAFVRLTVEDTGSGMPDEVLSRVFEPYFTTKDPSRGTGLGLSTVYGIVKSTGGYIWADSALGRGTTIAVYVPAQERG
jgi:signal transduction histidine kinase